MWNFSSSVQLDISLVRCVHLQDIKLNKKRALPFLQPFCHRRTGTFRLKGGGTFLPGKNTQCPKGSGLKSGWKRAKNDVFDDFPKISDHFPKILEKLSEGFRNVSEHFPKITEDSRRLRRKIRRCFDHTSTTLSTVKGSRSAKSDDWNFVHLETRFYIWYLYQESVFNMQGNVQNYLY